MMDEHSFEQGGPRGQRPGTPAPVPTGAAAVHCAVSFSEVEPLVRFAASVGAGAPDGTAGLAASAPEWAALLAARPPLRLQFGNEFCQRLLPSIAALERALGAASAAGLAFGLVLPMLTDAGIERAERLLGRLPPDTEVTVNDWGVLRRLARGFPALRATAGRLLCRMLKEPRAPSAAYLHLGGHGFATPGLQTLLERFGIERVEVDVPPFVQADDLRGSSRQLSVHAPLGFATTGRICRIGNLRCSAARQFATGHTCARECLSYWSELSIARRAGSESLRLLQRGNTIFYRHSVPMARALAAVLAAGAADRLVLPGEGLPCGS